MFSDENEETLAADSDLLAELQAELAGSRKSREQRMDNDTTLGAGDSLIDELQSLGTSDDIEGPDTGPPIVDEVALSDGSDPRSVFEDTHSHPPRRRSLALHNDDQHSAPARGPEPTPESPDLGLWQLPAPARSRSSTTEPPQIEKEHRQSRLPIPVIALLILIIVVAAYLFFVVAANPDLPTEHNEAQVDQPATQPE